MRRDYIARSSSLHMRLAYIATSKLAVLQVDSSSLLMRRDCIATSLLTRTAVNLQLQGRREREGQRERERKWHAAL